MAVKSWINSPTVDNGTVKTGMVQVQGVAVGGTDAVKRVEVSMDGGKTWADARFVGPDQGKFAWRQFALAVRLPAGTHTLMSRATAVNGTVQAEERIKNVGG